MKWPCAKCAELTSRLEHLSSCRVTEHTQRMRDVVYLSALAFFVFLIASAFDPFAPAPFTVHCCYAQKILFKYFYIQRSHTNTLTYTRGAGGEVKAPKHKNKFLLSWCATCLLFCWFASVSVSVFDSANAAAAGAALSFHFCLFRLFVFYVSDAFVFGPTCSLFTAVNC